jgi:light-regulated signal transduction histidine kinase (bacteriophytochrome)
LLYQANIGADGAVSLSILQDGALWGLVIAHHRHPHRLPGATRDQIDLLVRAFALRMEALLQRQAAAKLAKDMGTYAKFLIKLAAAEDFPGALTEGRPNVRDLFSNSAGAAVVWDEEGRRRFRSLGNVPSRDDMVELTTWLHAEGKGPVFATDCLAEHFPHILAYGEMSCGVLAILFEDTRNATLLLFRPEWVQTVSWAGKPEKLAGPDGVLNLPRQSFDRWTEIHRGHSIPWQSEELDLALTLCSTINQVILRHNQASATLIL